MNLNFLTEGLNISPYAHQMHAVEFFQDKRDGCLFFEMGTGKTGTAVLTYRNWCRKEGRLLRCLVVAPSVVLYNWRDEFGMFSKLPKDKFIPLVKGSGKDKAAQVYHDVLPVVDGMMMSVNYEALLNKELFQAIERWNPEVIIFDEVHYVKNPDAKRSKLCIRLAEAAMYRLGLTGTPILKNVMDMYGIFRTVDLGKTFGVNKYVFQSKYLIDKNASWRGSSTNYFPKWENNPKTFGELNEKVYSKSLRKLKSECLDLPDLLKVITYVDWGSAQLKAYNELKRDFLTFIQSQDLEGKARTVTAQLAIVKALRMLQVASGFVTTDDKEVYEFPDVPRYTMAKELLEEIVVEGGHKCIIWCSFKYNYVMMERLCKSLGLKYVMLTGDQNTFEKRESELAFQKGDAQIIIANRKAGGVGVNLTAAPYSIVYSRNFSLEEEEQSEARNHRGGSEVHEKITKYDLAIKDSIDEEVLLALRNKKQVSTDVLDMVR